MKTYNKKSEEFQLAFKRFDWVFKLAKDEVYWIAGGALRSFFAHEQIKDIDLFFPGVEERDAVAHALEDEDFCEVVNNDTVWRFRKGEISVDLVKRNFSSMSETLAVFDFTIACAALSPGNLLLHDNFFYDLAARRLRWNNLPFPVASLVRLQRFAGRGYRACPETLRKLAQELNNRPANAINEEHLYSVID